MSKEKETKKVAQKKAEQQVEQKAENNLTPELEALIAAVGTSGAGGATGRGIRKNVFEACEEVFKQLPVGTVINQGGLAATAKKVAESRWIKHKELMGDSFSTNEKSHRWYMHVRQYLQKKIRDKKIKRIPTSDKSAMFKKIA